MSHSVQLKKYYNTFDFSIVLGIQVCTTSEGEHSYHDTNQLQFEPAFGLPDHIVRYLATENKRHLQYRHRQYLCKQIERPVPNILFEWTSIYKQSFFRMDYRKLEKEECDALGVRISLSGIPNSGSGLYATRDFQENEVVGQYYGCYVRKNLKTSVSFYAVDDDTNWLTHKYFTENAIEVSIKQNAIVNLQLQQLQSTIGDTEANDSTLVYLVPFPCCTMRRINDGMDTNTLVRRESLINTRFSLKKSIKDVVDFFNHKIIQIITTKYVKKGKEFFISYGDAFFL